MDEPTTKVQPDVSVIVPARNEEACLAACLESLVVQRDVEYDVIVVDDHSTDATRRIAERFAVQVVPADPLPPGWTGKCNAVWTGAKAAKGKWLLFTDADTRHASNSIAAGLREAQENDAGVLSYSPKQEVRSLAERALMPVIFAELAATYRPCDVCDPASPLAAANGQYLLIRRDVYDAIGGHAAVAAEILEDVELAKRVKQAGYKLSFRQSDVVSTRMYRSFPQMWEGWTKNLALLFPDPRTLALARFVEFVLIATWPALIWWVWLLGHRIGPAVGTVCATIFLLPFVKRIRRAHFDWISRTLAIFGLPLFAALLVNSSRAHRRGEISWKGRRYRCGTGSDLALAKKLRTDIPECFRSNQHKLSWRIVRTDLLTGMVGCLLFIPLGARTENPETRVLRWSLILPVMFMVGVLRGSSSGKALIKSVLLAAPAALLVPTACVASDGDLWPDTIIVVVAMAIMALFAALGIWCKRLVLKLGTRSIRSR